MKATLFHPTPDGYKLLEKRIVEEKIRHKNNACLIFELVLIKNKLN